MLRDIFLEILDSDIDMDADMGTDMNTDMVTDMDMDMDTDMDMDLSLWYNPRPLWGKCAWSPGGVTSKPYPFCSVFYYIILVHDDAEFKNKLICPMGRVVYF